MRLQVRHLQYLRDELELEGNLDRDGLASAPRKFSEHGFGDGRGRMVPLHKLKPSGTTPASNTKNASRHKAPALGPIHLDDDTTHVLVQGAGGDSGGPIGVRPQPAEVLRGGGGSSSHTASVCERRYKAGAGM
jgi:hypothetical protein